jgi:hypothetical protein
MKRLFTHAIVGRYLDCLRAAVHVRPLLAIDFTASNGSADQPTSLHAFSDEKVDPSKKIEPILSFIGWWIFLQPNYYASIIELLGGVLEPYIHDKVGQI